MIILEKYTGEKTYMYPNGGIGTPEAVKAKFPAVTIFTHVVETDESGEVMFALQNLSAMRSRYGIDTALTETEAITQLETLLNTPEVIDNIPTPEERIAAALEYQVLASMPDETL